MKSCQTQDAELKAYIDGELPPARRLGIWWHLLRCERCREARTAMKELSIRLRAGETDATGDAMDEKLRARILSSVTYADPTNGQRSGWRGSLRRAHPAMLVGGASAAALLVCVLQWQSGTRSYAPRAQGPSYSSSNLQQKSNVYDNSASKSAYAPASPAVSVAPSGAGSAVGGSQYRSIEKTAAPSGGSSAVAGSRHSVSPATAAPPSAGSADTGSLFHSTNETDLSSSAGAGRHAHPLGSTQALAKPVDGTSRNRTERSSSLAPHARARKGPTAEFGATDSSAAHDGPLVPGVGAADNSARIGVAPAPGMAPGRTRASSANAPAMVIMSAGRKAAATVRRSRPVRKPKRQAASRRRRPSSAVRRAPAAKHGN